MHKFLYPITRQNPSLRYTCIAARNEAFLNTNLMTRCTSKMRNGSSAWFLRFFNPNTFYLKSYLCRMKTSGEQIDDRIVEVHWDPAGSHWRMMRFRDDKPNGNYRNVVDNIIQSIAEGVEKDTVRHNTYYSNIIYILLLYQLLARSNVIRDAWKTRHGQPIGPPPAPSNARPPPPPPPTRMDGAPSHAPPGHSERPRSLDAELRYGPLASSRWSKVAGPSVIAGLNR
jgi:mRNA guanylyltransferase